MTKRKAKTKRIFLSVFLAIALYLFTMTSCQSTADPPFYGEYFGRDLDECYEAWGIDPETDIETFYEGQYFVFFNDPAEYLGKEFNVRFGYVTQRKNAAAFENDKFTNITYEREYENVPVETVIKEVTELFAAIEKEFEPIGEEMGLSKKQNSDWILPFEDTDEPKPTEAEMIESVSKYPTLIDTVWEWHLPEEYKKADAGFVEQFEEFSGRDGTYCIRCTLEYKEDRFVFSVRHGFDFADEFGFHKFAASRQG